MARTPTPAAPQRRGNLRRSPRLIVAGILAICLGGLGSAALYTQLGRDDDVLRVTRTVARGEVVQPSDLAVVSAGHTPGGSTVPAAQLSELVGQEALTDLAAGSLLAPGTVGRAPVTPGTVHIGLRLAPGRIPVGPLPSGARVTLVGVPGTAPGADKGDLQVRGTIVTAAHAQPDGSFVVDVAVAAVDAPRVARLAAVDQIVLVREAER